MPFLYIYIYILFFFFTDTPPHMRPFGILFDETNSLFKTQQFLVNEAGNAYG